MSRDSFGFCLQAGDFASVAHAAAPSLPRWACHTIARLAVHRGEADAMARELAALSALPHDPAAIASHFGRVLIRPSRVQTIAQVCADHYQIPLRDLLAPGKGIEVTWLARMAAVYVAKTITGQSHSEIGRALGGRDKTTVRHAYGQAKRRIPIGLLEELTDRAREALGRR